MHRNLYRRHHNLDQKGYNDIADDEDCDDDDTDYDAYYDLLDERRTPPRS
jgi:hypothetical protein